MTLEERYLAAKEEYAKIGVDTEAALKKMDAIKISIQCWQGDDVRGFLNSGELSGGIQTTGNYPGKARNPEELRADLDEVLSLIPGRHRVNLHAIYAEPKEKREIDDLRPEDFQNWINWAKDRGVGLDFNPTCFSHPMAESGFTLSSSDENVRNFWIRHCRCSRKIAEHIGRELNDTCVVNFWVPDGYKDIPYDRLSPRMRLENSLDQIFEEKIDPRYEIDAMESKVFGIGVESYTTGSNEFYLGYAVKHQKALCLDSGHFHPTEYISDKLSAVSLFVPHILLHVSRPVRWDSDHVVIFDDELNEIARSLIRSGIIDKTSIGLDFFDASINRISAWVVGIRSTQKALLRALLEPTEKLNEIEREGNYTDRMYLTERMKSMDFGAVYDYYCMKKNVKVGLEALDEIHRYEEEVLTKRG